MTEQDPDLFLAFKIYKNGHVSLIYKGKTLETTLDSSEVGAIAVILGGCAITHRAGKWIETAFDNIFKEETKHEQRED